MERETGFEPATSTLARSHSTTELFPLETLTVPHGWLAFQPDREDGGSETAALRPPSWAGLSGRKCGGRLNQPPQDCRRPGLSGPAMRRSSKGPRYGVTVRSTRAASSGDVGLM